MTLPEACEVLNRHNHRGYNRWRPYRGSSSLPESWARQEEDGDLLPLFEAIAIAEKYVRETQVDPPAGDVLQLGAFVI